MSLEVLCLWKFCVFGSSVYFWSSMSLEVLCLWKFCVLWSCLFDASDAEVMRFIGFSN